MCRLCCSRFVPTQQSVLYAVAFSLSSFCLRISGHAEKWKMPLYTKEYIHIYLYIYICTQKAQGVPRKE